MKQLPCKDADFGFCGLRLNQNQMERAEEDDDKLDTDVFCSSNRDYTLFSGLLLI